jgi:gluconokinase
MTDHSGAGIEPGQSSPVTVVLMGVSGVGKTRVLEALSQQVSGVFAEGDAFHSESNVSRMAAGIPLTDEDRWPWLRSIAAWIGTQERESVTAVITCSALRRSYRDLLRDGHPTVRFVHLTASPRAIGTRVASRRGHFMPPTLLASQLGALEPLEPDEPGFAVDAEASPDEIARQIVERLSLATGDRPV